MSWYLHQLFMQFNQIYNTEAFHNIFFTIFHQKNHKVAKTVKGKIYEEQLKSFGWFSPEKRRLSGSLWLPQKAD